MFSISGFSVSKAVLGTNQVLLHLLDELLELLGINLVGTDENDTVSVFLLLLELLDEGVDVGLALDSLVSLDDLDLLFVEGFNQARAGRVRQDNHLQGHLGGLLEALSQALNGLLQLLALLAVLVEGLGLGLVELVSSPVSALELLAQILDSSALDIFFSDSEGNLLGGLQVGLSVGQTVFNDDHALGDINALFGGGDFSVRSGSENEGSSRGDSREQHLSFGPVWLAEMAVGVRQFIRAIRNLPN